MRVWNQLFREALCVRREMRELKRVSMAEEHCALYQITRLMHGAGEIVSVEESLCPVAQMRGRVRNYATKGMRSF
jgi:hypothetical protein